MSAADPNHYLTIGGLREDYFITNDKQVYIHKLGGNAVYAAVGARLYSDHVHIVSRIGSNYPTDWLQKVQSYGIDAGQVHTLKTPQDTRTFYAYLNESERVDHDPRRYFFEIGVPLPPELADYVGSTVGQDDSSTKFAPLAVRPTDVNLANRLKVGGAHLAPSHFVSHRTVPAALRLAGVKTVTLDPSVRYMTPDKAREVREIVAGLDAFLPSRMEVLSFFRKSEVDWIEAAEQFGQWGAKVVVIKQGPKGQLVYHHASGKKWRIPAYPVKVLDVTGAGDAYCGAFLVGLTETGDPIEAALHGTVAAGMAIEGIGALFALDAHPSLAQVRLKSWRAEVQPL